MGSRVFKEGKFVETWFYVIRAPTDILGTTFICTK